MKAHSQLAGRILFLISTSTALYSCGGTPSGSKDGGTTDKNAAPTTALVIKGNLQNADTPTNTGVIANQDVAFKSLTGEVIASAKSDANGAYEIPVAAGTLAINTNSTKLTESTTTSSIVGTQYSIVSSVNNDGSGKALGINKTINITNGAISSQSSSGAGVIDLGTTPLTEIGAITGSVSFADTAVSVQGTDVYIPGKSFFVRTGSDGKFHLLFVPAGTYTLRFENGRYQKSQEVIVKANKTTITGAVTVGLSDRNPLPLDQVLIGKWTTKCWETTGTSAITPVTGVLTVTSLTNTSYTGSSCVSRSSATGASAVTLTEIQVLSDSVIQVTHKITSTGVMEYRLWRVPNYSNNQVTINTDNGFEVLTRQ